MEQRQKAILLGANINNNEDFNNSMEELANLAKACDIETIGEMSQNLSRINNSSYFGSGKIAEVFELLQKTEAEMVIFNDELSPSQIRNLEKTLDCPVLDRTVLILDIFSERAKTREAKLQVEIARIKYMLPRLIGASKSLGRQGGGSGLKNKGTGEKKLELDRRKLEDRISALERELETLVSTRQNQRKSRKKNEIPVVALTGYTNAGKSTIMNAMLDLYHPDSEKLVLEKDMLFATLETSVRNITLPDHKSFLLTDTVGFISKLPHHLVKAFRSTLEEVAEADLLIHVVDYSNPDYKKQIEVTKETLRELGADQIPVIYAYNKIDKVESQTRCKDETDLTGLLKDHEAEQETAEEENLNTAQEEGILISARKKLGLESLTEKIKEHIFSDYIQLEIRIPYHQGSLVSYLNENASIKSTGYENDGIRISLECKRADYEKLKPYEVSTVTASKPF